jgi:ABC-type phosphate transport system auxiliary subunit
VALPHWLRDCIQVTDLDQASEEGENVLAFPRRTEQVRNDGQSAIDLVYKAAEVVGDMQDQARQTEVRAQTLCRNAIEKLRLAERRTQAAENALNLAESRIASAEARLSAAELRAKKAETRAHELDQALTLIEEAIRTRLLGASRNVRGSSAAVA